MALLSAVIFVTSLCMAPMFSRIAVSIVWHEIESLEFGENREMQSTVCTMKTVTLLGL